jgi:hypothetical protein
MKKILLLLIVLFVSNYSFSHTTEEEYSYVTKGLKIQIDGGCLILVYNRIYCR